MTHECFDVTIADDIAHLVLNRPNKRNSMIPAFWSELPEIVRDIDAHARARVIVISSTGPHFTAGLDLAMFDPITDDDAGGALSHRAAGLRLYQTVRVMQDTFNCLEQCRLPVLAAIQGGCIGGGVDLVTACDMRYATRDAFVTIYEINIGMTADVGTFPRIFKLIPEGIARELAYTGRRMTADEARAAGLVNRVFVDQATMLDEVLGIAREIAAKPPLAIHGCKHMANYARDHSTQDSLDRIALWNASMLQREEIDEAIRAGKEKRTGEFVDLPALDPLSERS